MGRPRCYWILPHVIARSRRKGHFSRLPGRSVLLSEGENLVGNIVQCWFILCVLCFVLQLLLLNCCWYSSFSYPITVSSKFFLALYLLCFQLEGSKQLVVFLVGVLNWRKPFLRHCMYTWQRGWD